MRRGDSAKESDRQLQAFEYYYGLGDLRTYGKVASFIGTSATSIRNWAEKFNWDERIKALDTARYAEIADYDKRQVLKEIINYRRAIKASVAKYLEALKNNQIEIKSVKDLSVLIRLDMDLLVYIDNNKDDRPDELKDDYVEFYFSDKYE